MQWHKWVVLIAGSTALHYVLFALPTFNHARCD
jgi:DMSO/TMAO reductase YedYZ heme-binding membrane subunit